MNPIAAQLGATRRGDDFLGELAEVVLHFDAETDALGDVELDAGTKG